MNWNKISNKEKRKIVMLVCAVGVLLFIVVSDQIQREYRKRVRAAKRRIGQLQTQQVEVAKKTEYKKNKDFSGISELLKEAGRENPFKIPEPISAKKKKEVAIETAETVDLLLTGITMGTNGRALAVINGKMLGEGDIIESIGVVISKIETNKVIITKNGVDEDLYLGWKITFDKK